LKPGLPAHQKDCTSNLLTLKKKARIAAGFFLNG